jgi:hypothetical protein
VALHLKKASDSSNVSDILAVRGRVVSPFCENRSTLSTGAEVAGTQNMLANSGRRDAYASLMNNGAYSLATKTKCIASMNCIMLRSPS